MLFVKNLNYNITGEDLYDLFGRYGSIRQIRLGNDTKTKGTAFVVFEDVMDVSALASLPLLGFLLCAVDANDLSFVCVYRRRTHWII